MDVGKGRELGAEALPDSNLLISIRNILLLTLRAYVKASLLLAFLQQQISKQQNAGNRPPLHRETTCLYFLINDVGTEPDETAATKLPEGWPPHFVREGETFYMLSRPSN